MPATLVIKVTGDKTMFHFRPDQDYGADRTAQLAYAESVVGAYEPDGTEMLACGLADSETLDAWMGDGTTRDKDTVLVTEQGNVTLPE